MLLARGIPSSTSNDLLSKLKVFLADNGFMGSFYDDRLIDNALFEPTQQDFILRLTSVPV